MENVNTDLSKVKFDFEAQTWKDENGVELEPQEGWDCKTKTFT